MNELISIIVPIYNGEKYIDRCVESIINQTYKKIELILINDGSTDNSAKICDEWTKKDDRIKVVHKENGGVSSARNEGLKYVSGDYIGWVDSDDWIEPEMYETMLKEAVSADVDIVICGHTKSNEPVLNQIEKTYLYKPGQALTKGLCQGKIFGYLCDKLYKRECFDGIYFSGDLGEDYLANFKILLNKTIKVKKIEYVGYHYIQRDNSITHNAQKTKDHIEKRLEFREWIRTNHPKLLKHSNFDCLVILCQLLSQFPSEKKYICETIKKVGFKYPYIRSNLFRKRVIFKMIIYYLKNK